MKTIIAITGKSGSGKSTAAHYLRTNHKTPEIKSYTTRPKRPYSEPGHTFVSNKFFDKIDPKQMIAYSLYGEFRYCATKNNVTEDLMSYVVDVNGLKMLLNNLDYNVISINIKRQQRDNISSSRKDRDKEIKGNFDYTLENTTKQKLYKDLDHILYEITEK